MNRRMGVPRCAERYYQSVIKTAISLDEELLRRVDAVARELDEPRSRVLARAAEDFLRRLENQHLLESLNRAYSDEVPGPEEAAEKALRRERHRRLVEGEW
jgi:predicted transcriptional regulator